MQLVGFGESRCGRAVRMLVPQGNVAEVFVVWSVTEFGSSSHTWAPQRVVLPGFQNQKNVQGINWSLIWTEKVLHQLRKVPHCWYRCFVLHADVSWLLRFMKCQSKWASCENLETVSLVYLLTFLRGVCAYLVKSSAFSTIEERKHWTLVLRKPWLPLGIKWISWRLMWGRTLDP